MSRPKNPVPSYRLHRPSGQAVVTVPKPGGGRRDVYLGPYGSPESQAEYRRVLDHLRLPVPVLAPTPVPADVTVSELLVGFLRHADAYYRRPDGTPTSEAGNYRDAVRYLRRLFGPTPAREFGPVALKAVRQAMVDAGLCRPVVNKAVGRIRSVFKWAAGEELIPFDVYHRLTAVAGLRKGRSAARDPDPVGPVDPATVAATLPFLGRHVAAMVRVQLLTGMRPGEVCRLSPDAVDTTGDVWRYTPQVHKTAHRGKGRVVHIGPPAQHVLKPFLGGDAAAPVFSPAAATAERRAAQRAARKTKPTPSERNRRKSDPARVPGAAYTPSSYAHAVANAVRKANRAAGRAGKPPIPHWHPNQLRHTFATEVRRRYGLEAAQVLLGHERADVTQVYAERDQALAARVVAGMTDLSC